MANRKKAKQRRKRQLNKRISAVAKSTKSRVVPSAYLYMGKYAIENVEYQEALDAIYKGKVRPFNRYVNPNVTLVHHCSGCKKRFYARPKYLLSGKDPHVCYRKLTPHYNPRVPKSKKTMEFTLDQFQALVKEGLSYKLIAEKMQVNPAIIKDYFKREGLL